MKELAAQIRINAPAEKVWGIFTDFASYPRWNPFITSLKGPVDVGGKIEVVLSQPGSNPMLMRPTVLEYRAKSELRWIGHLFVPGLFDGDHRFLLSDNGDGTTTFTQGEVFTGALVPLFSRMLDEKTKKGFESMNEKLKEQCEG